MLQDLHSRLCAPDVFSRKPSPAFLAEDTFDEVRVREDLQTTKDICGRHGCDLELILKDISTVRYEPQRLWKWADVTLDVVGGQEKELVRPRHCSEFWRGWRGRVEWRSALAP